MKTTITVDRGGGKDLAMFKFKVALHTLYLSFFLYTNAFWGLWKLFTKKVHKFAAKTASLQNSVNQYLVGVFGVLVGVFVTWDGTFDVWDELSCNFITKIAGFASMFGLHKLYSKQSLLRFLWKKVHRLEKSTPTPLVALQTNISYVVKYEEA